MTRVDESTTPISNKMAHSNSAYPKPLPSLRPDFVTATDPTTTMSTLGQADQSSNKGSPQETMPFLVMIFLLALLEVFAPSTIKQNTFVLISSFKFSSYFSRAGLGTTSTFFSVRIIRLKII